MCEPRQKFCSYKKDHPGEDPSTIDWRDSIAISNGDRWLPYESKFLSDEITSRNSMFNTKLV
jgi:hypothetical protein